MATEKLIVESVFPVTFEALIIKLSRAVAPVTVPEISQVVAFKDRPAGRAGDAGAIEQVAALPFPEKEVGEILTTSFTEK